MKRIVCVFLSLVMLLSFPIAISAYDDGPGEEELVQQAIEALHLYNSIRDFGEPGEPYDMVPMSNLYQVAFSFSHLPTFPTAFLGELQAGSAGLMEYQILNLQLDNTFLGTFATVIFHLDFDFWTPVEPAIQIGSQMRTFNTQMSRTTSFIDDYSTTGTDFGRNRLYQVLVIPVTGSGTPDDFVLRADQPALHAPYVWNYCPVVNRTITTIDGPTTISESLFSMADNDWYRLVFDDNVESFEMSFNGDVVPQIWRRNGTSSFVPAVQTNGVYMMNIPNTMGFYLRVATPAMFSPVMPIPYSVTITPNVADEPIVTSIIVTPNPVSVQLGQTQQFSAEVLGENNPNLAVNWSVSGGTAATIDQNGLLTIPVGETATSLTITATSVQTPTVTGTAAVEVLALDPVITGITITPNITSIVRGTTQQFQATVTGEGDFNPNVEWFVNGTASSISQTGLLTVGINETVATLWVQARAVGNHDIIDTVQLTVQAPPAVVTSVVVNPVPGGIQRGTSRQLTATVTGTNNPPTTVTWEYDWSNLTSWSTTVTANGMAHVAANEGATFIRVRAISTHGNVASAWLNIPIVAPPQVVVTNFQNLTWTNGVMTGLNGTSLRLSRRDLNSSRVRPQFTGRTADGQIAAGANVRIRLTNLSNNHTTGIHSFNLNAIGSVPNDATSNILLPNVRNTNVSYVASEGTAPNSTRRFYDIMLVEMWNANGTRIHAELFFIQISTNRGAHLVRTPNMAAYIAIRNMPSSLPPL